jgi:hypothetical protein
MNYYNFKVNCFAQEFDPDEMPEMRRETHSQACARRKAISAQTRMSRARLAARRAATDSNEIPQGPTELVGAPFGNPSSSDVRKSPFTREKDIPTMPTNALKPPEPAFTSSIAGLRAEAPAMLSGGVVKVTKLVVT